MLLLPVYILPSYLDKDWLLAASPYPDMKEGYIPAVAAFIEFPSREDGKKWNDSQENQISLGQLVRTDFGSLI